MAQAEDLASVLHAASAPDRRGDAPPARLRGPLPLHRRDQPARERRRPHHSRGDRLPVRHRHRPDGRDPLEGHLRAARGRHRRRPSTWPTSSRASSSRTPDAGVNGQRDNPRDRRRRRRSPSTSPTASTTPPTSWRRRSRRGRWRRASRSGYAAILNFVGRVHLARGGGHRRHRTSSNPASITPPGRLRRAGRSDRLEPHHVVLRAPVELLARAHRRHRGRRARGRGAERGLLRGRHPRQGDDPRRWSRRSSPSWSAALAILLPLPDRRTAASRSGQRAASASGRSISGGLLALAHGTNDAQKTMGVITLALVANGNDQRRRLPRAHLGRGRPRPRRSRSAPTPAAGGSSRRWAAASIKMDTAQGFAAQGARRLGDPRRLGRRLPALHDAHDLRRRHRRRAPPSGCPRCAGAWPATSSSPGCSPCPAAAAHRRAHLPRHARLRHRRRRARWSSRP